MITQRLVLDGGYPDGLWACAGCGAKLTSGDLHGGDEGANLTHRGNCTEMSHKVGYEAGVAAERDRLTRSHVAEQDAVHEDLALLLRVLGLGDHARPYSAHEVMLDAINEAGKLRALATGGTA